MMPRCRCGAQFLLLFLTLPAWLMGQRTASLDAGATSMAYADGANLGAIFVSPHLELRAPWRSLVLDGSFARFGDAEWSTQGQVRGSFFTPAFAGPLRAEFMGHGAGTAHQDGAKSGELGGAARVHLLGAVSGGWIGAGAGRVFNGLTWSGEWAFEAGAWISSRLGSASFTLSPRGIGSDLRFTEAELAARTVRGPLELTLFGGMRHWSRPVDVVSSLWGGASGVLWLSDHVAVTAAGGGYPEDFGQGLPRGRYLSAGLRIATGRNAAEVRPDLRRLALPSPGRQGASDFRMHAADDGVTLEVRAPAARTVELMGDVTEWAPVSLTPTLDGWWSIRLPVTQGVHRINVRIDGGDWGVPSGMTRIRDEFGGSVGLIVVAP
ncbi:MAG TPA: glycogen-binding domain-containing protein [Candidatus Limnocylindria bacterium]|nr:glycogen-binding domain-containing protein [Candidatus Limnocylindria bacterium]